MIAFDHIRFRIHRRNYSSIRAIMAETGESDTTLLRGLRDLHGIYFDSLKDDPLIFFTEDTHQLEEMEKTGILNPTVMQVILTSKAFALDEEECKTRWYAAMEKMKEEADA